jgi:Xaa-Pro dipeptidase
MLLNRSRAQGYMSKYELKALIATSPENVSYLTDLDCWMYRSLRENMLSPGAPDNLVQSYSMLPLDGEPALVISTDMALFGTELWVKDIRTYGSSIVDSPPRIKEEPLQAMIRHLRSIQKDSSANALIDLIKDRGIEDGRVGLELKNLSEHTHKSLMKAFPNVEFLDCTELIRLIRMVKTEEEIERLKRAAEISERAVIRSLSHARDGVKTGELIRLYCEEIGKDGAVFEHFIYSPKGLGISGSHDFRLKRGDFMYVDFGCIYKMYYSDSGNTLFVGQAQDKELKLHKAIWEIIDETMDAMRPGVKPSSILDFLSNGLEKRGITNCSAHGHAIGLETREYPIIMRSSYSIISDDVVRESTEIPLEEGMVVNLEAPCYMFGVGSFHVERTFLIGKESAKDLSPQERVPFVSP